jgi:regulator of replication initiation timing
LTTEAAVTAESSDVTDEQVTQFFDTGGATTPEGGATTVEGGQTTVEGGQDTIQAAAEPKPDRVVPLGALHEERARRKELQAKVERMEQTYAKLTERLNQPPQPQVPAFEENPAEHLRLKQERLEQQLQQQSETVQQSETRRAQEAQLAQFDNAYQSAAMQYAKQTPEFTDAYQHLIASRHQAYEQMGVDPGEYVERLKHEERQIAHTAFTLGVNPGALLHNLATAAGWKPKPQKQTPNLEVVAKGVQTKSLSGVSGKPTSNMTLEALAEMNDEDFDKNWDKLIKG